MQTPGDEIVAGWLLELWAKRPAWIKAMPDAGGIESLVRRINDRIAAVSSIMKVTPEPKS